MPLEKSLFAANGHAMLVKEKVVIQSAFDVGYTCVIEHTVYVSDSLEAWMNLPGMEFLAKVSELINLRNPMVTSTIFPGKCVKLTPYWDKLLHIFHKGTL